jgi:hypothetical protein
MVFTPEQKIFMIESYFRNGQQDENGTWVYQIAPAFQEFTENFPNVAVLYEQFSETLRYYGGQKISSVIFPSFQKNRCSPFLIVIMIDVFTCHF